ncbi:Holliday junction resolvase RuvX [Flavobacterium cheniae]|uniref:Putative pre-16S rRNA nuclease n=1 Tax=Flavobacterium cheniae TaxID=295428 RepID=A0A562KP91_9FLAO|nr:Holliday junction resolvase RuvX [Flavobacterium cheniae]TDR23097.1 putative Holliday junction resolvase [Flavobacterium cheniae]TWH97043.1 putative Holliday junction resolvase [Flavobacterium cheniae]
MRILAIDYGIKRTGIAVTDEMQMIAFGLTTVASETAIAFLKDYFSKEKVERVIVGEPKQMDGTPSQSAEIINAFVTKFQEAFPEMSVERVDERFTSKMAFQTMIDSGLNKKQRQNKALVDEIAATIILQDYLRYKK